MTREDVIRMAREAGIIFGYPAYHDRIEHFAALIASRVAAAAKAEEREACAGLLDKMAAEDKWTNYYKVAANAVRARGAATSRSNNDD